MSNWAGTPEQEIETLRKMVEQRDAENEALRGRVAQLETAALNAVQFMHGGQAKADLRDAYDEEEPSSAWLLRKQAEVVEGYAPYMWPPEDGYPHLKLFEYVKRLRQQADELERNQ